MVGYYGIFIEYQLKTAKFMKDKAKSTVGKVLVVDDNLLNRKLACAILKSCDLEYEIAENGKIAFEAFKDGGFCLVLMDIQMPIMNGIESTKMIRKHETENKVSEPVPIIAVTTFSMHNDMTNCFEAGMNDLLAKPYKTINMINIRAKYIELPAMPKV